MPKTQINSSRRRRLLSWFGRHKMLSVFVVLVLAALMYWAATVIAWNHQVNAERARYMATAQDMRVLSMSFPTGGQIKTYQQCSYTSNGAVFATRSLGCETGVSAVYSNLTPEEAHSIGNEEKTTLLNKRYLLKENRGSYDANTLAIYTFDTNKLNCDFSATYYGSDVPSIDRYEEAPPSGTALLVDLGCSGPAKAEYFPVVQD